MTEQTDGPHLYGTPDPDNPEPVAKGGMRGERTGDQASETRGLTRDLSVDGRNVSVEETSGSVYAEQTDATAKQEPAGEDR